MSGCQELSCETPPSGTQLWRTPRPRKGRRRPCRPGPLGARLVECAPYDRGRQAGVRRRLTDQRQVVAPPDALTQVGVAGRTFQTRLFVRTERAAHLRVACIRVCPPSLIVFFELLDARLALRSVLPLGLFAHELRKGTVFARCIGVCMRVKSVP